MKKSVLALAATLAVAATVAAATNVRGIGGEAQAAPSPVLPASVVSIQRPASTATFKTEQYDKSGKLTRTDRTTWRVVQGTGNCCENYLTITPKGRLLDFGGTYINYSDDRGLTWKQVQPLTPLVNGEGTIALAPNGDVIAIGWDPYSGDHLQAFKYDADSATWYWAEQPLHQPFYDREWVTVDARADLDRRHDLPVHQPAEGRLPVEGPGLLQHDGLDYTNATSQFLDETLGTPRAGLLPDEGGRLLRLDPAELERRDDSARRRQRVREW